MGACRETQNLVYFLKQKNYKKFWHNVRRFNRITFDDTFMPYVCKVIGHKEYITDFNDDPLEYACKRCHRYTGKTISKKEYDEQQFNKKREKKLKRVVNDKS